MAPGTEIPTKPMPTTEQPTTQRYRGFQKGISGNPSGRSQDAPPKNEYARKTPVEQRKDVEACWRLAAYLGVKHTLDALKRKTKKPGEIAQITTSAAIAKDKAFPDATDSIQVKVPSALVGTMQIGIVIKPVDKVVNQESLSITQETRMDSDDSQSVK